MGRSKEPDERRRIYLHLLEGRHHQSHLHRCPIQPRIQVLRANPRQREEGNRGDRDAEVKVEEEKEEEKKEDEKKEEKKEEGKEGEEAKEGAKEGEEKKEKPKKEKPV